MENKVKVNKSAFVRNVLREIGALSQNPPEGWRQQVEDALKKQNIAMNTVTIYQLRSKAMKGDKAGKPTNGRRGRVKTTLNKGEITLTHLNAVRDFAEKFGGLESLIKVIDALKAIKA